MKEKPKTISILLTYEQWQAIEEYRLQNGLMRRCAYSLVVDLGIEEIRKQKAETKEKSE